jgi:hypothetical protein
MTTLPTTLPVFDRPGGGLNIAGHVTIASPTNMNTYMPLRGKSSTSRLPTRGALAHECSPENEALTYGVGRLVVRSEVRVACGSPARLPPD